MEEQKNKLTDELNIKAKELKKIRIQRVISLENTSNFRRV